MSDTYNGRLLLFERLRDDDLTVPYEPKPRMMATVEELRESVRRELQWLLNTRAPRIGDPLRAPRYGIPEFSHLSVSIAEEREDLCSTIVRAIEYHETRLKNVSVELLDFDNVERAARLSLRAVLKSDQDGEPILFDLVVHFKNKRGAIDVYGGS